MSLYIGTTLVIATPMTDLQFKEKHGPGSDITDTRRVLVSGYAVEFTGGYMQWMDASSFFSMFRLVSAGEVKLIEKVMP